MRGCIVGGSGVTSNAPQGSSSSSSSSARARRADNEQVPGRGRKTDTLLQFAHTCNEAAAFRLMLPSRARTAKKKAYPKSWSIDLKKNL